MWCGQIEAYSTLDSRSIMQLLINEVKLMPESDAASLAESRKVRGIRIVTEASSESRR